MEGVHLSRDELFRIYGISPRLAVRIGALLAKGLSITPTILDIAGPGSPVEAYLLQPELLAGAEAIDSKAACKLAEGTRAAAEGPFAVVAQDGGRVLALAEEFLAEEGWQSQALPEEAGALVRRADELAVGRVLDQAEAEQLFDPEEIARLKLEALAGRDAEARISALRKLLYAPLSAQQKGSICLRALSDSAAEVRGEAVTALESLGFDRDTADVLRMILEQDPKRRRQAITRIGDLIVNLQTAERDIVLLVLVELFRETTLSEADDPLLQVLAEATPLMASNAPVAREVVRVCVQHLLVKGGGAERGIRELIVHLAGHAPATVLAKLWEEADTVREPALHVVLLSLLLDLETDAKNYPRLCDAVAKVLLLDRLDELTRQSLGHRALVLGAPAAQAVLEHYRHESKFDRVRLLPFLDAIAINEELPLDLRHEAMQHLLDALKSARRGLHADILRSRVFHQKQLPPRLEQAFVSELLAILRTAEDTDSLERTAFMLETVGDAAAQGLFDLIKTRPGAPETDQAMRSLANIIATTEQGSCAAAQAKPALEFTSKRMARPRNRIGGYAYGLGAIAATGLAGKKAATAALDQLAEGFGKLPYPADLVTAIGTLATTDLITPRQRVQVVHLLGGIIDRPPDQEEALLRKFRDEQGPIYEVTGAVEFDSETLPAAVQEVTAIALCEAVAQGLREQIAELLLRVWSGVAEWKIVWGPRSSESLAQALGRIGADAGAQAPLRIRVLRALAVAPERLSVVKSLELLFEVRCDNHDFNDLVLATAGEILDHWIEPEILPEALEAVLRTAASAAARPEINSRTKRARMLRRRTSELLFDALRNGNRWTREPLEKMRTCKTMPKAVCKEIDDRVKLAFSLTPNKHGR